MMGRVEGHRGAGRVPVVRVEVLRAWKCEESQDMEI